MCMKSVDTYSSVQVLYFLDNYLHVHCTFDKEKLWLRTSFYLHIYFVEKKQMHMACTKSNSKYNTNVHLQYADSLSMQTLTWNYVN